MSNKNKEQGIDLYKNFLLNKDYLSNLSLLLEGEEIESLSEALVVEAVFASSYIEDLSAKLSEPVNLTKKKKKSKKVKKQEAFLNSQKEKIAHELSKISGVYKDLMLMLPEDKKEEILKYMTDNDILQRKFYSKSDNADSKYYEIVDNNYVVKRFFKVRIKSLFWWFILSIMILTDSFPSILNLANHFISNESIHRIVSTVSDLLLTGYLAECISFFNTFLMFYMIFCLLLTGLRVGYICIPDFRETYIPLVSKFLNQENYVAKDCYKLVDGVCVKLSAVKKRKVISSRLSDLENMIAELKTCNHPLGNGLYNKVCMLNDSIKVTSPKSKEYGFKIAEIELMADKYTSLRKEG